MKFALIVNCPPSAVASFSAYRFAQTVVDQGHTLVRVFFYQDGVYNGNDLPCPPQDELNMTLKWQLLADTSDVDLCVCVAAAIRRGVLNADEAKRYSKQNHNLAKHFSIAGLGQLMDATTKADRVITFG